MNRDSMLSRLDEDPLWDVLVIGGGATGLGTAVDAASRGYSTLLLEQHDFAKGTSSRSTKLVHGGVRYLRQGNVSLVLEALRERGLLFRNAPHLVHNLGFIVPVYDWWEGPFYGVGLKLYDALAGKLGLGPSRLLSREETLARIPTLEPGGLDGGVVYYDGQFDDARLAITLARTAAELGAAVLNYMPVIRLLKDGALVSGVVARDAETGAEREVRARAVINATGVFVDAVRAMDDAAAEPMVTPSQGVHIVLDRSFQPGDNAIMVPHTDDGRVLFAVPWHDCVVVGTTDTPVDEISLEPRALPEEVEFLLSHAARYLTRDPTPADVKSVFAGLRPLVRGIGKSKDTAAISRDHTISVSTSGMITVTGGKWTTYRKMAEDTVDVATQVGGLDEHECVTSKLRLHGWSQVEYGRDDWQVYGSDARALRDLIQGDPTLAARVHPDVNYTEAEVVWAARHEMARTVEDVLARRSRALLLDARASVAAAPRVAAILQRELARDAQWASAQVGKYTDVARGYLL